MISITTAGDAQVIGNRIAYSASAASGIGFYGPLSPLAVGNIIMAGGVGPWLIGIYTGSALHARVFNNLVNYVSSNIASDHYGIGGYGQIEGNIVLNRSNGTAIYGSWPIYNLCYPTNASCGSIALKVNPQFIDTTDYKLAAGSPAIDAGPPDPLLSDLDRTRNDMGPHGGPWPIDQFDAQRDPAYTGPFIYPLFDANASLQDSNTLQVRALGVARLR